MDRLATRRHSGAHGPDRALGLRQPLRRVRSGRAVCQHRPGHTLPVRAAQAAMAAGYPTGGAQLARARAAVGRGCACVPVPTAVLARHGSCEGCLRQRRKAGVGLPLHLADPLYLPKLLRRRASAGVAAHPVVCGAHQPHWLAVLVHQLGLAARALGH